VCGGWNSKKEGKVAIDNELFLSWRNLEKGKKSWKRKDMDMERVH